MTLEATSTVAQKCHQNHINVQGRSFHLRNKQTKTICIHGLFELHVHIDPLIQKQIAVI